MEPVIRQGTNIGAQRGVTLMLAILVLLALTFSALGLMYFVRYDTAVSGNVALHAAALQASDVGLETASQDLAALATYPETMKSGPPWWYVPPPQPGVAGIVPADPGSGFWGTCYPAQCGEVTVPYAGNPKGLVAEFVVEPTGLRPQVLNGTQIIAGSGGPVTTYHVYDAFINVSGSNFRNLNVNVEATLRKGA